MSEATLGKKTAVKMERSAVTGHHRDYGDLFKPQDGFLQMSYAELEMMNLEVKRDRISGKTDDYFKNKFLKYLASEAGIKAVTMCFSDMEGRLHVLDYDKKFLLGAYENLTFDGSSIRGFTAQCESDLRLQVDWGTFRWLPADIFGAGKVLVFAYVCDKDGSIYDGDFRAGLGKLMGELAEEGISVNVAPEIEGFLFKGLNTEQYYDEKVGFDLATQSGYFNCLPQDILRLFIDKFAEVQRALGFENEKDHPEVAPAQFELNFKYCPALDTADQIQIYKLLARQIAKTMGYTACFLPKPIQGMNGSGMHINMSLAKEGKNMFYDAGDKHKLSKAAYKFLTGILYYANDICLTINPSVNAYRRLDPHFEAPNEIKMSAVDRGSMVRLPIGNEKSARIEVRTVAPDANPYLAFYTLVKAGLSGMRAGEAEFKMMEKKVYVKTPKKLPADIYSAIGYFVKSKFMKEILNEGNHRKYVGLKEMAADRSPKALGTKVKSGEILYHHEVANQWLWNEF